MTALHLAVQLEKIEFLSYLLEGDFDAYKEMDLDVKFNRYMKILNSENSMKHWILQSLFGIERCSLNEGYIPMILSMKCEKEDLPMYLINIAIVRERIRAECQ
jgi:hypothetical protein